MEARLTGINRRETLQYLGYLGSPIPEELETEIEVGEYITTIEHDYPHFHLSMRCYWCRIIAGAPVLKEHEAARWLTIDELDSVDWLPADRQIIGTVKAYWRTLG